MSSAVVLYTNGDMEFLVAILNGMGVMFDGGRGGIAYLGRIALMLNIFYSIWQGVFKNGMPNIVNILHSIFIYIIFFQLLVPVVVYKDNEGSRTISGKLPVGLVYPASVVTRAMHGLAWDLKDSINDGFGVSDSTPILAHGLTPLNALLEMRKFRVDGAFSKSDSLADSVGTATTGLDTAIHDYYMQCVEKYILLYQVDVPLEGADKPKSVIERAINANDSFGAFKINQSGWPYTSVLDGNVISSNCANAHEAIENVLESKGRKVFQERMSFLFGDSPESVAEMETKALSFLRSIDPMLAGKAVVEMSKNLYTQDLIFGACANSVALGPSHVQSCAGQHSAIQERRFQEAGKSDSWREMAIPMMTFIEGFVYMLMPVMFFVALIGGQAGFALVFKYMMALLWVALWPICQVAVDTYLHIYFGKFVQTLQLENAGVGILSANAFNSAWLQLESFVAFAGTAQAMVPALAMFILYAGVHAMQGLAAAASSGGTAAPGTNTAGQSAKIESDTVRYGNQSATYMRHNDGTYDWNTTNQVNTSTHSAATSQEFNSTRAIGESLKNARQQVSAFQTGAKADYTDATSKGIDVKDSTGFKLMAARGESVDEAVTMAQKHALQEKLGDKVDISQAIASARSVKGGVGVNFDVFFAKLSTGVEGVSQDQIQSAQSFFNQEEVNKITEEAKSQFRKAQMSVQQAGDKGEIFSEVEQASEKWSRAIDSQIKFQQAQTTEAALTEQMNQATASKVQVSNVASAFAHNSKGGEYLTSINNVDAARDTAFDALAKQTQSSNPDWSENERSIFNKALNQIRSGEPLSQETFNNLVKGGANENMVSAIQSTLFKETGEGQFVAKSAAELTEEMTGISDADMAAARDNWKDNWGSTERTKFVNSYFQNLDNYFEGGGTPMERQLRSTMSGSIWSNIGNQEFSSFGTDSGKLDSAISYGEAVMQNGHKLMNVFADTDFQDASAFNEERFEHIETNGKRIAGLDNDALNMEGNNAGTAASISANRAALAEAEQKIKDKYNLAEKDAKAAVERGKVSSEIAVTEDMEQVWNETEIKRNTMMAASSRERLEEMQGALGQKFGTSIASAFGTSLSDLERHADNRLLNGPLGEGVHARVSAASSELTGYLQSKTTSLNALVADKELTNSQIGELEKLVNGGTLSYEDSIKLAGSLAGIEMSDGDVERYRNYKLDLGNEELQKELDYNVMHIANMSNMQGNIDNKLESMGKDDSYSRREIDMAKHMAQMQYLGYDVSTDSAYMASIAEFNQDRKDDLIERGKAAGEVSRVEQFRDTAVRSGEMMHLGDQVMANASEEHQKIWNDYLNEAGFLNNKGSTFATYMDRNGGDLTEFDKELRAAGVDAQDIAQLMQYRRDSGVGLDPEHLAWHKDLAQEVRNNGGEFSADMFDVQSSNYHKLALADQLNSRALEEQENLSRTKAGIEDIATRYAALETVKAAHEEDNGFTLSEWELEAVNTALDGESVAKSGRFGISNQARKELSSVASKAVEAGLFDFNESNVIRRAANLDSDKQTLMKRLDENTLEFAENALKNARENGGQLTADDMAVQTINNQFVDHGVTDDLYKRLSKVEASTGEHGTEISQEERERTVKLMSTGYQYGAAKGHFEKLEVAASRLNESQQALFKTLKAGGIDGVDGEEIEKLKHSLNNVGGASRFDVSKLDVAAQQLSSAHKAILDMKDDGERELAMSIAKEYESFGNVDPINGLNDYSGTHSPVRHLAPLPEIKKDAVTN